MHKIGTVVSHSLHAGGVVAKVGAMRGEGEITRTVASRRRAMQVYMALRHACPSLGAEFEAGGILEVLAVLQKDMCHAVLCPSPCPVDVQ